MSWKKDLQICGAFKMAKSPFIKPLAAGVTASHPSSDLLIAPPESAASAKAMRFQKTPKGQYFFVTSEVLCCFAHAWSIKFGRDLSKVNLPPVGRVMPWSVQVVPFAVSLTETLVTHGARRTGRKCFFRAYILAHVLRRRGLPVLMNVGIGSTEGNQNGRRIDGHCWLTLNDEPYFEEATWPHQYPHFLATGINGIRYWIGTTKSGV